MRSGIAPLCRFILRHGRLRPPPLPQFGPNDSNAPAPTCLLRIFPLFRDAVTGATGDPQCRQLKSGRMTTTMTTTTMTTTIETAAGGTNTAKLPKAPRASGGTNDVGSRACARISRAQCGEAEHRQQEVHAERSHWLRDTFAQTLR